MRSIVSVIAAIAVLVALDPRAAMAQRPSGSGPSRGPGWLPRAGKLYLADYKITRAELSTAMNVLTVIEETFLKIPELAHPDGFEIAPSFGGFGPNESLLHYGYDAMFFAPSRKVAGEGTACIRVLINHVPGGNRMEGYSDDRGPFFFEDDRGDPIPGATHVWNHISPTERSWLDVMFAAGNRSPLEPVSGERFQRAMVAFFEGFRSSVQRETPYDKWMAEAPPGAYPSVGDLFSLVSSDTPQAARVFVPRPEVYQGHRSRVAPRVIQVHLSASLTCQTPAIQRAMFKAQSQLDWAALARLVDPRQ